MRLILSKVIERTIRFASSVDVVLEDSTFISWFALAREVKILTKQSLPTNYYTAGFEGVCTAFASISISLP